MSKKTVAVLFTLLMAVFANGQFDELCPADDSDSVTQTDRVSITTDVGGSGNVDVSVSSRSSIGDSESTVVASVSTDGPGRCSVTVNSSPSEFAEAADVCFNEGGSPSATECRNVNVRDDVACVANAVASAFGFVSAACAPNGVGCGAVSQDSDTISCRAGRAIREVAENVGTFGDPICEESIVAAINSVRSESGSLRERICSTPDSPSTTSNEDFIAGVQDIIANALAACVDYCQGSGL